MKKLIKRADGSKSPRGLWDNIRANKGSGKKPTKEMLKQEAKIKKEENMKEYKNGGKKSAKVMKEAKREKESFITESKELKFGNPKKFETGGPNKLEKPTTDSTEHFKAKQAQSRYTYKQVENYPSSDKRGDAIKKANLVDQMQEDYKNEQRQKLKGKTGYDKNGNPKPELKGLYPNQKDAAEEALKMRKGGKKTMEPGGGGRFAKMVNKMKGQGKSEESAKAIAASIGRKKYGKSKFQEMAAAGKKKMGDKKC